MNRRSLGFIAIGIIALMALVATAGLDSLPKSLRTSVEAASKQVPTDEARLAQVRGYVDRSLAAEPDLFRAVATPLRSRLQQAQSRCKEADAELAALKPLVEANRREDRERVEHRLSRLDASRKACVAEAEQVNQEVDRRLTWKRELPRRLEAMRASHDAVAAFDVASATAPVAKAMTDWPAKRDDLQARLQATTDLKTQAERSWESSTAVRQQAEANQLAGLDYAALFAASQAIETAAAELRTRTDSLNRLAGQLYVNWDKLLLNLDDDPTRQQVRVVRVQYPDSTLTNGQTTSEEKWEDIDRARFRQLEDNVGMVVERKPAGKYESEAERAAQPPAHAYVAPPGQSNAYGSWSNGVWSWLPQYLLMDSLLRGRSYPPIRQDDYYGYDSARRRGEVYRGTYGRTWGDRNRSYGSSGRGVLDRMRDYSYRSDRSDRRPGQGYYSERPRRSEDRTFGSGSYGSSRYQSRGSYGGSRYQSRGGGGGGFGSRSYSRGGFGGGRSRGGRR